MLTACAVSSRKRAISALNQPNILTIYDIGTHEGMPFMGSPGLPSSTGAASRPECWGIGPFYPSINLSPDGKSVAVQISDLQGVEYLWRYEVARGIRTRFTTDGNANRSDVWSPDSNRLVFNSRRKGEINLYQKAADGTGEYLLLASDLEKTPSSWSQDGGSPFPTPNRIIQTAIGSSGPPSKNTFSDVPLVLCDTFPGEIGCRKVTWQPLLREHL